MGVERAVRGGARLSDITRVLDRRARRTTRRKGDAKPGARDLRARAARLASGQGRAMWLDLCTRCGVREIGGVTGVGEGADDDQPATQYGTPPRARTTPTRLTMQQCSNRRNTTRLDQGE